MSQDLIEIVDVVMQASPLPIYSPAFSTAAAAASSLQAPVSDVLAWISRKTYSPSYAKIFILESSISLQNGSQHYCEVEG